MSVYSTKLLSSDTEIHFLVFEGCMFEGNKAFSGSAVDIAPTVRLSDPYQWCLSRATVHQLQFRV